MLRPRPALSGAADAADVLDHVLNTRFEYAVLTRGTFSAVLLNPPYDGETETGSGTRLEERFLAETTPLLAAGGVMVYIIPHARITEAVARHPASWYEDLRCYRLAGEDYVVFKQVVIFGSKGMYRNPSGQRVSELLAWAGAHVVLPALAGCPGDWIEEDRADGKKEFPLLFGSMSELLQGGGEYLVSVAPEKGERGQAFRFCNIRFGFARGCGRWDKWRFDRRDDETVHVTNNYYQDNQNNNEEPVHSPPFLAHTPF
ncbi:MAG: DUF6094 domain-containing protein [Chloroflexota bacterium]